MATRRESVLLDLDDRVTPGLLRVAAAAEVADKSLERLGGRQTATSQSTRTLEGDTDRLGQRMERNSKSIDKYSGRLGLLVSALTAVGPAAIPIAAVAVPAVTALGSGIAFAAAGAGTFVLAFHGVGDALKAVNKADLEPTIENIQAAQLAMSQLPPATREFVRELHGLQPLVTRLQGAAGQGLFPGLTDGLEALRRDEPIVTRGLHNIGSELGDLSRQAGQSLSSNQWRPFLRFVGTEAPHELGVLGHATGDVAHGLAELWMAFTPVNRDVDAGILKLAADFDKWATAADRSKDFQSFLAYVETNGPRVVELLGDTSQLFVDIVQAAAPLGGPTLQALDGIVKILDLIAKSPLATPLLALGQIAAVLKLASRGMAGLGLSARVGLGGITTQAKQGQVALGGLEAQARATGIAMRTIAGNASRYTTSGTTLMSGVTKEGKAGLGKSALLGAGIGLAASGLDQQMGLTNTATLALAGSLAGPFGAAAGGAVGVALDLQSALDRDSKSMEVFTNQVDALAQAGKVSQLQDLSDTLHKAQDAAGGGVVGGLFGKMSAVVDPALAKTKARMDDLTGAQRLAAAAAGDFGRAEQVAARQTLAMRKAADATAAQFLTLGDDVDNTKVSLNQWIRQMANEAKALRDFGNNARAAADKGLRDGLIKQLETLGPAGALRMRQLANASQQEIAKANHAFAAGKSATQDLTAAYAYLSNHPPVVSVNGVPQSISQLRAVLSALNALHDKTIRVTTERTTGGHSVAGDAAGGYITGPGGPTDDLIPAWLSSGEFVMRASAVDQYGLGFMHALNAGAYASGGPAGTATTAPGPDPGFRTVAGRLNRFQHALDLATKSVDQERQHRDNLVQAEQQLASTVRDNFRSQLFGVTPEASGSIWDAGAGVGAMTDPAKILHRDIRNAREYRRDIAKLHRRGLHGGALAEVDTLAEAQQALALPRTELATISRLYALRQQVSRRAGQTAGDLRYGNQIDESNKHLHNLNQKVDRLNKEVVRLRKEAAKNADRTGNAVKNGVNHQVRNGVRRAKKP